jgi:uncharacterized membrane protein HdeD (DUF308 family)
VRLAPASSGQPLIFPRKRDTTFKKKKDKTMTMHSLFRAVILLIMGVLIVTAPILASLFF